MTFPKANDVLADIERAQSHRISDDCDRLRVAVLAAIEKMRTSGLRAVDVSLDGVSDQAAETVSIELRQSGWSVRMLGTLRLTMQISTHAPQKRGDL